MWAERLNAALVAPAESSEQAVDLIPCACAPDENGRHIRLMKTTPCYGFRRLPKKSTTCPKNGKKHAFYGQSRFGLQTIQGLLSIGVSDQVSTAFFAHIGGFVVGAGVGLVVKMFRPPSGPAGYGGSRGGYDQPAQYWRGRRID